MVTGTNKKTIKHREVDVVEIKYFRDTDPIDHAVNPGGTAA